MRSRPHRPYVPRSLIALPTVAAVGLALLPGCDPPPEGARRSAPARRQAPAVTPSGAPPAEAPSSPTGAGPAVVHRVRFPDARNHHVDAESVFPTGGRASLALLVAVWTPGSYLVREFSFELAPGGRPASPRCRGTPSAPPACSRPSATSSAISRSARTTSSTSSSRPPVETASSTPPPPCSPRLPGPCAAARTPSAGWGLVSHEYLHLRPRPVGDRRAAGPPARQRGPSARGCTRGWARSG